MYFDENICPICSFGPFDMHIDKLYKKESSSKVHTVGGGGLKTLRTGTQFLVFFTFSLSKGFFSELEQIWLLMKTKACYQSC